VNYHQLRGKDYRVLDVRGPKEAERHIRDGMRGAKKEINNVRVLRPQGTLAKTPDAYRNSCPCTRS